MKYLPTLLIISAAFAQDALTNDALFSLQQLRTVIPERQWVQEFSILVDTEAYEQQAEKMMDRQWRDDTIDSQIGIARPISYLLNDTMSGETIRILDWYQEFEEGIFWRRPSTVDGVGEK